MLSPSLALLIDLFLLKFPAHVGVATDSASSWRVSAFWHILFSQIDFYFCFSFELALHPSLTSSITDDGSRSRWFLPNSGHRRPPVIICEFPLVMNILWLGSFAEEHECLNFFHNFLLLCRSKNKESVYYTFQPSDLNSRFYLVLERSSILCIIIFPKININLRG